VINAVGAAATGVVLVIVAWMKFLHGAWIILVAVPLFVAGMAAIRRHYLWVASRCGRSNRSVAGASAGSWCWPPLGQTPRPALRFAASSIRPPGDVARGRSTTGGSSPLAGAPRRHPLTVRPHPNGGPPSAPPLPGCGQDPGPAHGGDSRTGGFAGATSWPTAGGASPSSGPFGRNPGWRSPMCTTSRPAIAAPRPGATRG
jgi:hypothetical protein